jgi:hypothetical protein
MKCPAEGTHIDAPLQPQQTAQFGTSDRSINALHPLDNRSRKRTDPRRTSGELL